jgi:transporter family-2 protein
MGGGIGIFVVLFNNLSIKNIGVSLTLSLGIAGQIITSIFLEHIGFLGTEKKRFRISMLPGIVMILAGSIMIII